MSRPVKVQIIKPLAPKLLIRILSSNEQKEMTANEFVRRIEEGVFELVGEEFSEDDLAESGGLFFLQTVFN